MLEGKSLIKKIYDKSCFFSDIIGEDPNSLANHIPAVYNGLMEES